MGTSAEQMQGLLDRLSHQEASSRKLSEELLLVQKDNVFLQREMLNFQKENKELKEKYDALQGDVALLKQTTDLNKQLNEKLTKCDTLQSEVAALKQSMNRNKQINEKLKKLDVLHADVVALKQIPNQIKQLKEKLKTNDEKTDAKMTHLSNTQGDLKRALNEGHKDKTNVKTEVDKLSERLLKRITPFEKRKNQMDRSQVDVRFDTGDLRLVTGYSVRLIKCQTVNADGGSWNVANCCVRLDVSGHYFANVVFCQDGEGEILMNIKSDKGLDMTMGRTTYNNDLLVSTHIVFLPAAQDNLWLSAFRLKGMATIRTCMLYVRLM